MARATFTRRRFIGTAATTGIGVLVGPAMVSAATRKRLDGALFAGTLITVASGSELVVDGVGYGPTTVQIQPGAFLERGHLGRVADATSFVAGDEVVVDGEWKGTVASASLLQTLYRQIGGTIVRSGDGFLVTSEGVVHTPDSPSMRRSKLPSHPAGRRFTAEVWLDPAADAPVAMAVDVE
jgi:hypothetical protein